MNSTQRSSMDTGVRHLDVHMSRYCISTVSLNKSAQSNLGRGPRRGTVAYVHRKVPIGYNVGPQKVPLPVDRSLKPRYLLHPWTRPTYNDKRHPVPIRRFSAMHWTDRRTDRQIVHGSLISIGRCATTATRPKMKLKFMVG